MSGDRAAARRRRLAKVREAERSIVAACDALAREAGHEEYDTIHRALRAVRRLARLAREGRPTP